MDRQKPTVQSRALLAPGTRLNWRPEGVTCFESNWSILQKLVYLNEVNISELCEVLSDPVFWFDSSRKRTVSFSLHDFGFLSRKRLQWLLKIDRETAEYCVTGAYLPRIERAPRYGDLAHRSLPNEWNVLRFCRTCLAKGFHSPLFQVTTIARCPVHQHALEHSCPRCRREIPYHASSAMLSAPYHCPYCNELFWPDLQRQAWVSGLSAVQRAKFARYVSWIGKVSYDGTGPGWSLAFEGVSTADSDISQRVLRYLNDLRPLEDWANCFNAGNNEEVCLRAIAGPALRPVEVDPDHRWKDPDILNKALVSLGRDFYLIYKSVRRHLKRRYVVRHSNCRRLLGTLGVPLSIELRCPWVLAYHRWRERLETYSHAFHDDVCHWWEEEFFKSANFPREMMNRLRLNKELTDDQRAILIWVGGRWYVFQLLAMFRAALSASGLPRRREGPRGIPFLHWQPATDAQPHKATWWSTGLNPPVSEQGLKHGVGRAKLRRLLLKAKETRNAASL